ncbi:MAG TPA: hypothetical protein DFS52_17100 [Myxococcales bacterium]|nr:hypothetical protein [Myxococcales bacterium]
MLAYFCVTALLTAAAGSAKQDESPREPNERSLAVVAFGRCEQAPLGEATRALRREVTPVANARVLSEAETAEPGGGLPRVSVEEVRRAIEAGRTDFLNLNIAHAEKTLWAVLPEIDRLPIGPERWNAYWSTRVHLARVLEYLGRKPKATELFLEILKVQEDFSLNRIEFPPSTREQLELTRSLMAGLPRYKLTVTSRKPGQPVFVNGFPLGKTPFEKSMVSGTYALVVGEPHRHAFVRQVLLQADTVLEVEPEREAGFRRELGPCFEAGPDREERLALIAALAPALGADEIIAVRLERLGAEDYLAAALVEVRRGREVREGRVRLEQPTLPRLADLARFALTGEGEPGRVELVDPSSYSQGDHRSGSNHWLPAAGWILAGATAVLGGVAVYEHWRASGLQADAEALLKNGALSHLDKPEYDRLRADAASARGLRNKLAIGAGASAVGAGVSFGLMLLPGERGRAPSLTAAVASSF